MQTTLPARYYTDLAHHERELERFYFSRWICAGRSEQIEKPGQYFLREVGRESVIVVRGDDGRARAFYNVCRHRGTRLCEEHTGQFKGTIQCPYHAWTYGLDGALVGAPGMKEVAGWSAGDWPLRTVHAEEWDGHVFLSFAAKPAPLAEQLGPLPSLFGNWRMAGLRLAHRIDYQLECNWKLVIQNYSECLHCPIIHPALNKLSHYLSGENEAPNPYYLGGRMVLRDGITTMTMDGATTRPLLPDLTAEEKRHVYYYSVLPNLLLSLHPDYMMTHTLWPRGPGKTDVICEFHFHPEAMARPDFSPADAVEFWDLTNRQDWRVSELSQLGIASRGYTPGPYSHRETLLAGLDDIVRED